jgi:hypothetical protein
MGYHQQTSTTKCYIGLHQHLTQANCAFLQQHFPFHVIDLDR